MQASVEEKKKKSLQEREQRVLGESKYEKYWRGEKWKEQRLTQSPEDYGSSLSVYPCKAKSLERALSSKSSALYTTPALC